MEYTLDQIAGILGGTVEGNAHHKISTISSIEEGSSESISFLSNLKYEHFLYSTKAGAVIVNKDFEPKQPLSTALIRVDNAYTGFTLLLEEYQRIISFQKVGREYPSFVDETASIDEGHYLGAFSYIGKHTKIEKNVKIYPQVYIGDHCQIGEHCILYPGVKVYTNTIIGNYCTLHAGSILGSDGFGFAQQNNGSYKAIPQIGNVILEDHVSIGANTTIDCATLNSTLIKKGVKIDNLVQVAHNVEIGENTVIASQTGISGSTKVGKQVVMAGQVGVVGHIEIGDHAILTAQTGISKSVPANATYFGSPGYDKTPYMKSVVLFRKLPDMMQRIQELEKKI